MNDTEDCEKLYKSHSIPHVPSLYVSTMEGEEITPRNKIEELIMQAVKAEKDGNFRKALKNINKAIKKYEKCFYQDGWAFERYYLNLLELKTKYSLKLKKWKKAEKTLNEAYKVLDRFIEANKNEKGWKREYIDSEQKMWEALKREIEKEKQK
jgi:tetratricopeptide (TPR) repeat protein